jgi:hypothetical protein
VLIIICHSSGANSSLLPFKLGDVASNMTITLQLGVQAGVDFDAKVVEATAVAGSYLHIPEVTIGRRFNLDEDCLPALAAVDLAAGAYVDVGGSLGKVDARSWNPTAATRMYQTAFTTCFNHPRKTSTKSSTKTSSKPSSTKSASGSKSHTGSTKATSTTVASSSSGKSLSGTGKTTTKTASVTGVHN